MVLVEVLIGAAIIAAVVGLFLAVLVDAGATIGKTRGRARELMIASQVLRQTETAWPSGARSGDLAGYDWVVTCADPPSLKSVRLALIECTAMVRPGGAPGTKPEVSEKAAWAAPVQPFSQP